LLVYMRTNLPSRAPCHKLLKLEFDKVFSTFWRDPLPQAPYRQTNGRVNALKLARRAVRAIHQRIGRGEFEPVPRAGLGPMDRARGELREDRNCDQK